MRHDLTMCDAAGKTCSICAPFWLGARTFRQVVGWSRKHGVQIPQAGHAQFWHAPCPLQVLANGACFRGPRSDATYLEWAATLLTAQMLQMLPPPLDPVRARARLVTDGCPSTAL